MKVTLGYKEAIDEVNFQIESMRDKIDASSDEFLKQIGELVKVSVKDLVPRSHEDYVQKNYDGTTPYVHIVDDVKTHVRTSKGKDKKKYVSIGGGFYTGYKWQWVDGGFTDRKGVFHSGNHFMEKAVRDAMPAIAEYLNRLSDEVVNE